MVGSAANSEEIWNIQEQMAGATEAAKSDSDDDSQPDALGNPGDWVGDEMWIKSQWTGARIATMNTNRKFMMGEVNWEIIYELMIKNQVDIIVLTEPGKSDEMSIAALKN